MFRYNVQDDVGASSFLTVFFLQLLVVGHNNEVSGASQRGRGDEASRRLNKTARPCMHADVMRRDGSTM